jgi:hypothetical protein
LILNGEWRREPPFVENGSKMGRWSVATWEIILPKKIEDNIDDFGPRNTTTLDE